MTGHARLAPSSAYRWTNCPGSVRLVEQYNLERGDEPGGAAAEGTAAHWLAAGGEGNVAPNGVVITDDMRDAVKPYRAELAAHDDWQVEQRVVADSVHKDCWGTCDAYRVDHKDRRIVVMDLKYGYGLVEVYENPQLMLYAIAIADMNGVGHDWFVDLAVVQPRAYHRSGPVRRWPTNVAALRLYARHLRTMAEEALGNDPRTVTGAWCKHCPARHVCPALREAGMAVWEITQNSTPVELDQNGLAMELSLLTEAQAYLTARLTGLTADAMSRIRSGSAVPGWTLEHGKGREEWTASDAEVMVLGDLYGVPLAKPLAPITPAQARKAGLTAEVVAQYAARKTGEAKLVQASVTEARRVFG